MNTLSTSINNLMHNWKDLSTSIQYIENQDTKFPIEIEGIHGSLFSYFLAEISRYNKLKSVYSKNNGGIESYSISSSDVLIVVPTEHEANDLYVDIQTIIPDSEVYVFPSWGAVPYKSIAKGSVVFGKRAGVLSKILDNNINSVIKQIPRFFIVTQRTFMSPLPNPLYLKKQSFKISKNDKINTIKIADKLSSLGFIRVPRVSVRGEFSLRGEVLDIFLPCDDNATRIIFDFDTIEAIKSFEIEDQTTINNINSVLIYPLKEVIWTKENITTINSKLDEYQSSSVNNDTSSDVSSDFSIHLPFTESAISLKDKMIEELTTLGQSEGEELLYGFLWNNDFSILDYFDKSSLVLFYDYDRQKNALLSIKREFDGMYRRSREIAPILPPDLMLNNYNILLEKISRCLLFKTISTIDEDSSVEKEEELEENILVSSKEDNKIKLESEPSRSFFGNINYLKDEMERLQKDNWNIFIFTDNENQNLRIHEIFKNYIDIDNKDVNPVVLIPKEISSGFSISDIKLLVIQENEIFGRKKYVAKSVNKSKSSVIDTFIELNPGDYVVHVNWGIGLFHGIERVKSTGNERDYIKLEYADEEFAFVPIEQVNLVQRYIGNEGEKPRLDRIGSKAWENRKNKVKKIVEDIAQKLIDLYSRRKASVGFAFPKDTEWQAAFEAAFSYDDTADQVVVTEEIKTDMEKPIPMDRLVCGDVGYGKTEMAMRAAFKAVMGGKQVAFLAPTTILAEQHYETCIDRFRNFPVKIARLSRFVLPAEQKKILLKLSMGEIDILVGTHRIIQKDIHFKNLGLMIIDEEQRFGVKDKEKLKEMKNNIDCLAMSATPIPRTLHMSLLKIRDMSLLTTPPKSRQAIETVVDAYSDDRVAKAIRSEMERGGQVFYLHNRVESLLEIRKKIEQIVPESLVDVAHGQMSSSELDDIFHRFKMGGFNVLIATTIIENGIDIPNVNTIIIDRADMYGVSQLYQLRGRVGRSDRQAYAYLLYPGNKSLSEVAMKRLQVISDFTELGSGFKIAMKDMEIRGAGNLLGKDQSGDVYSVGFDLYVKLLNEAVHKLSKDKSYVEASEVLMEMEYTGFIPDSYIVNPQIKMEIYKKIASVVTESEFNSVLSELIDRFGPIPDEVSSLLSLAEIRIICRKLNIASIKERQGEVKVEFSDISKISIDKIMKLIKNNTEIIRLNSSMPNVLFIKLGKIGLKEKSEFIREKLSEMI